MTIPRFPAPLVPGNTIAVVAPASVPNRDNIERFQKQWRDYGFRIQIAPSVFTEVGYLAGGDQVRAAELTQAFLDPNVNAIFAARGGYGVNRMVDFVDWKAIVQQPKIFAGFSDMTTLHGAFNRHSNMVTFHSPHPNDGLDPASPCTQTQEHFFQSVTKPLQGTVLPANNPEFGSMQTLVPGRTVGKLVGGNLAVLASTIGTPFCPEFDKSVLFLEDIGEAPYRIDRYLSQLRLAGALDVVAGILLGHFTDCDDDSPQTLQLQQIFDTYLGSLNVPVLGGVRCGHELPNLTLPMNAMVELDADAQTLVIPA